MDTFDRTKILTIATAGQACVGEWGWFGNHPGDIEAKIIGSTPQRLERVSAENAYPFEAVGSRPCIYFYPAPYEYMQTMWVIDKKVARDTLVEVTRTWATDEQGFPRACHVKKGERFVIKNVRTDYIEGSRLDPIRPVTRAFPWFALAVLDTTRTPTGPASPSFTRNFKRAWENSTFDDPEVRVAKRDHVRTCARCGRPIYRGEEYTQVNEWANDDSGYSVYHKLCTHCSQEWQTAVMQDKKARAAAGKTSDPVYSEIDFKNIRCQPLYDDDTLDPAGWSIETWARIFGYQKYGYVHVPEDGEPYAFTPSNWEGTIPSKVMKDIAAFVDTLNGEPCIGST